MFRLINNLRIIETTICRIQTPTTPQIRTTYILKRRFPPFLHRKGHPPKKFRHRHYIYDLVQDTNIVKKPNIEVILTSYVDGLGNIGDKVFVKPQYAYGELLLPGLAVYATPENEKEFANVEKRDEERYSSPNVQNMKATLTRMVLSIIMNKDVSWNLEPWHVRTSFRKMGIIVPEKSIEMPQKPITGPNLDLEGKVFYVTVTINNTEKVKVRCRIHHWSTDITERLPYVEEFWKKPIEPLFAEDVEVLESIRLEMEKLNTRAK